MRKFFQPYATFFALPDVARTLVMTWFARLPVGMTAIAMLLFLRDTLGDFQRAGGIVGAYFISMAVSAPIQGRIIDRQGPKGVLLFTGIAQPLFVLSLFVAANYGASYAVLMACAIAGGLLPPPITVLTRTLWRHRFTEDSDRRMAFSVDAVFMELCFTVGPSVVALMVALFNPRVAYLFTVAGMFASVWIFLRSPALKYWKQEPPADRHLFGPLTELRLVALFGLTFGLTFCFGLMEVGYPAYARAIDLPAFGGVLLTINSVGSALGGAVYGGLHLKMAVERQFTGMLLLMALTLGAHGLVGGQWPFSAAAFLAGAAIAPAIAAQSLLVSRLAPALYATEAFTWSSTFIVCGLGAGMAAGGAIAENVGIKAPFLIGSGVALLMAGCAWFLHPPRQPPTA